MAISTKKKNAIIAMWKTGKFKSFTSIAKEYKISTKTAQKIIGDTAHSLEGLIDLGVQYENAKKSTKNPQEIRIVESVVEERTKHVQFFQNSAIKNQKLANTRIDEESEIYDLKLHADITNKNKQTVLGKDADTQVNIQNNQVQVTQGLTWE